MKEIIRWYSMGQGSLEQYILDEILDFEDNHEGAVGAIDGWELEGLLETKAAQASLEPFDYVVSESIWPTREYYIYYNYHPSSGYTTKLIGVAEDGDIELKVVPPQGRVLCAFWSEVIIFRK